jgi:hypothetical protein
MPELGWYVQHFIMVHVKERVNTGYTKRQNIGANLSLITKHGLRVSIYNK